MILDGNSRVGQAKVFATTLEMEQDRKIKERDELIKDAMPYIEYLSKGRLYSNHLVDVWIEKAKKLVGEK